MALGRHQINVTLDTASDPDDTVLLAAQGVHSAIYLLWMHVIVTTLQASSTITLEDGVGGNVLMHQTSTGIGTTTYNYVAYKGADGLKLSDNTALNATIAGATGVVARIVGETEVRGH